MKPIKKIFVLIILQSLAINLLCGQSACQKQINDLILQKAKLNSEKTTAINQLKQGKFCSQCNRTAIEIEKSENISFKQHLINVNGKEIPASPEVIKQKEDEYNQKLKDFDSQIYAIRLRCKENTVTQNKNLDNNVNTSIQNPDNPFDNTYNPQKFGNNNYIDGKSYLQDSTNSNLPKDLSELINKNTTDSILCLECKVLIKYRDNELFQDYLNALNKYVKTSQIIEKYRKRKDEFANQVTLDSTILASGTIIIIMKNVTESALSIASEFSATADLLKKAYDVGDIAGTYASALIDKDNASKYVEEASEKAVALIFDKVTPQIIKTSSLIDDIEKNYENIKDNLTLYINTMNSFKAQLSDMDANLAVYENMLQDKRNKKDDIQFIVNAIDKKCGNIKCDYK